MKKVSKRQEAILDFIKEEVRKKEVSNHEKSFEKTRGHIRFH